MLCGDSFISHKKYRSYKLSKSTSTYYMETEEEMPSDFYAHVFTGKSVHFNQLLSEVA